MSFHPVLSPSPLEKAFSCVVASQQSSSYGGLSPFRDSFEEDAANDLPPFWLSPPEVSLLRSAEENPLEYTLAEADDAISYVRILLKMLNQVTVNATAASSTISVSPQRRNNALTTNAGSIYYQTPASNNNNNNSNNDHDTFHTSVSDEERIITLDAPMLSEDEAFEVYYGSTKQYKRLVVAHYCVTKIYEIICVSLDSKCGTEGIAKMFHGRDETIDATKMNGDFNDLNNELETIHLEHDDWRPLLKILYSRSSDEYTKRGSALILAFILKAGCELDKKLSTTTVASAAQSKPDEDLLDLFSDEHKTSVSPSLPMGGSPRKSVVEDTLMSLIEWLTSRLQQSGSLGIISPTLGVLMSTTKPARLAFVQSGGIGYISRHLRARRKRPRSNPTLQRLIPPSSTSSRQRNLQDHEQPILVRIDSPPNTAVLSPARKRGNLSRNRSPVVTQNASHGRSKSPDNYKGKTSSVTGIGLTRSSSHASSLASSVSSNLGLSEIVERNMDTIFSNASGAASRAAAMARSAAPEGFASLAASTANVVMATDSQPSTSPKGTAVASSSSSVQELYDLTFCLWCLSLDCSTNEIVFRRFCRDGAIPALAHLLTKVPREKVLRMILACLQSLSKLKDDNQEEIFIREMIGCGILKSLNTVKLRRWNDSDLEEDLEVLQKLLTDRTEELTQWSTYEAQIATGVLRWDEMFHTPEFFRANVMHMEGTKGDFGPLKLLVNILYSNTTSGKLRSSGRADEIAYVGLNEVGGWDEEDVRDDDICETLAVCLFDVGEFARNYPNGKAVLGNRCGIGAKALIMQYVHHPRDTVREQALLCASKMLVKNWRAIEQ